MQRRPSMAEVEQIFARALEHTAETRTAFIAEACAGDSQLMGEIQSLLAADQEADHFLSQPALVGEDERAAMDKALGATIGPYRLVRQLGEGGSGDVFLGQRHDGQFRQYVAIKVLKTGIRSATMARRFARERQILASLDHAHIARLIDGGQTEHGRPYLVMEYVDGIHIDRYCRLHALSIPQRLQLFLRVCAAVHYAHQNLIVHRDLKPSNILVTRGGIPKLVDFGIAKLLDPELAAEHCDPTATVVRLMTPHYASPEQIYGRTITTASDVYSLGVLLYQLISQRRPYEISSIDICDMQRVICQVEPPPPSRAHGKPRGCDKAANKPRHRAISTDLDKITMMAMHKEPHHRYGSAQQLAQDIERHQRGLPIMAHSDTWLYRTLLFMRRHVAALTITALAIAVLATATITALLQADIAHQERERAEQVSQFVIDLFAPDPERAPISADTPASELLRRGAARVRQGRDMDIAVRGDLSHALGTISFNLGLLADALPAFQEALALRRQLHGPIHEDVASSLHQVAKTRAHMGQDAIALFREDLAMHMQLFGDRDLRVAQSMFDFAEHLLARDEAEAEAMYRGALEIRRTRLGDNHPLVADSRHGLAFWHLTRGQYREADEHFRRALDIRRIAFGTPHMAVSDSLNSLAILYHHQGYYARAEGHYRGAIAQAEALLGRTHYVVVNLKSNLASTLRALGRYREAEAHLRATLQQRRKLHGDDHPAVDNSLQHLAALLYDTGAFEQAEVHAREALERRLQRYGPQHRSVATTQGLLADIRLARGDSEAAIDNYRRALDTLHQLLGEGHPDTFDLLGGMARAAAARGQRVLAQAGFERLLALRQERTRADHPAISDTLVGLANILTACEPVRARTLLERALHIRQQAFTSGDARIDEVVRLLAEVSSG